jgi:hypothetical protein
MRKRVFVVFMVLVVLAVGVMPAGAVTDGELDGNDHPYVGLMLARDITGAPLWRCSGTLLSETVFLTAGHCTEAPAASATVWFNADVEALRCGMPGAPAAPNCYSIGGTHAYNGSVHTHPSYDPSAFFLFDLGVVVLDTPVTEDEFGNPITEYGELPQPGQLNSLKTRRGRQDTTFTAVGYGLQQSFPDAASWKDAAFRIRMVAHPHLIQINGGLVGDFSLLLSNNAHTGGTCFGDSGGPNFLGDSNVVAGVTSFGLNGNCAGTGGVYRVDQPDDQAWLATFGVTP